jgi:hypothetical protein
MRTRGTRQSPRPSATTRREPHAYVASISPQTCRTLRDILAKDHEHAMLEAMRAVRVTRSSKVPMRPQHVMVSVDAMHEADTAPSSSFPSGPST